MVMTPMQRLYYGGLVVRLPKCGCDIVGEGTLPDPLRIAFCARHADADSPWRDFDGDVPRFAGYHRDEAFNESLAALGLSLPARGGKWFSAPDFFSWAGRSYANAEVR